VCIIYRTVNYLKSLVLENLNSSENFTEYNIEKARRNRRGFDAHLS